MRHTIQLEPADLIAARYLALRPRTWLRSAGYVLVVLYAVGLAALLYDGVVHGKWPFFFFTLIFAGGYFAILYYVVIPWRTKRIFQQQKALHFPFTIEFMEEEFALESSRGNMRIKWTDFHKWKASDKVLLLYHSDAIYNLIPRRAFSDDAGWDNALALVGRHLGSRRVR